MPSLGSARHGEALALLMRRARGDPDELVRAYAVLSLGDVLPFQAGETREKTLRRLEALWSGEEKTRVKLALSAVLYRMTRGQSYVELIYDALGSADYSIRCFALNRLSEVVTEQNRRDAAEEVARLKRVEKTAAVRSAIARLERECLGGE